PAVDREQAVAGAEAQAFGGTARGHRQYAGAVATGVADVHDRAQRPAGVVFRRGRGMELEAGGQQAAREQQGKSVRFHERLLLVARAWLRAAHSGASSASLAPRA